MYVENVILSTLKVDIEYSIIQKSFCLLTFRIFILALKCITMNIMAACS